MSLTEKEVMPLITTNLFTRGTGEYWRAEKEKKAQRDADQKWSDDRLEAREKEWREKEADWLENYNDNICNEGCMPTAIMSDHIAELRSERGESCQTKK